MPHSFDKKKYVIHYENLPLYLRFRLKLKKYRVLEHIYSSWLKPYVQFNTKKDRSRKNDDKDGKVL